MEPLAEVDPEDRKGARAETPAPEATAWLADPDGATKPKRLTMAQRLADQPQWTGPWPAAKGSTPEDEE